MGGHVWSSENYDILPVQYYNEDCNLPVYKFTKRGEKLGIEQLGEIMLFGNLDEKLVCCRQPTNVCHNSVFVVDLHMLIDPYDIRADDNGTWNRTGSPIAYVSVHEDSSGHKSLAKRSRLRQFPNHFKISRVYFKHSTSPDFKRIITTAEGL